MNCFCCFSESRKLLGEAFPAAKERQHCPKISLLKLQWSNGPRVMRHTCMHELCCHICHALNSLTISKDISSNLTVSYQKNMEHNRDYCSKDVSVYVHPIISEDLLPTSFPSPGCVDLLKDRLLWFFQGCQGLGWC